MIIAAKILSLGHPFEYSFVGKPQHYYPNTITYNRHSLEMTGVKLKCPTRDPSFVGQNVQLQIMSNDDLRMCQHRSVGKFRLKIERNYRQRISRDFVWHPLAWSIWYHWIQLFMYFPTETKSKDQVYLRPKLCVLSLFYYFYVMLLN